MCWESGYKNVPSPRKGCVSQLGDCWCPESLGPSKLLQGACTFHPLTKLSGGAHQAALFRVGDTRRSLPCCLGLAQSGTQSYLLAQPGAHLSQCSFQLHRANPTQRDVQLNGLLAPSNLSSGSITHPDSPLHDFPPGACPTNASHGALTARVIREGKQGAWWGTGASSKDTRKGAHGPKPRALPPHRDQSHPSRGVHGPPPMGSAIT